MKLRYSPYTIKLKEEFNISINSRITTPAIIVEIEEDGFIGYGEASLPPYLKENQQSVINFLEKLDFSAFRILNDFDEIFDYIDKIDEENHTAKAAVDIGLHDLYTKMKNLRLNDYLIIKKRDDLYTSFTIGISDVTTLKKKISKVQDYKYLKIKLGSKDDKNIISLINSITDKKLFVDVNQGWYDEYYALDMISWLAERNVLLVEQPLPKEKIKQMKWLYRNSPLPLIADEAIQSVDDIYTIKDHYSGINIKLMKCGGIRQAIRLIDKAKKMDLKIMIGCMTETSCAITAACHLAPLADWIDLDGAELISNDLFSGAKIVEGKLILPDRSGLGIEKISI